MQLACRTSQPAGINAGKAKGPGNNAEALAKLAPEEGFEPPAKRLTAACSTTELLRIRASHRDPSKPRYEARSSAGRRLTDALIANSFAGCKQL
jgi:hypothetical protein